MPNVARLVAVSCDRRNPQLYNFFWSARYVASWQASVWFGDHLPRVFAYPSNTYSTIRTSHEDLCRRSSRFSSIQNTVDSLQLQRSLAPRVFRDRVKEPRHSTNLWEWISASNFLQIWSKLHQRFPSWAFALVSGLVWTADHTAFSCRYYIGSSGVKEANLFIVRVPQVCRSQ